MEKATAIKKPELIDAIAASTGEQKNTVTTIVNAVFEEITKELKKGTVVDIYGFGKFKSIFKEAHAGRNPRTGETTTVPAKYKPKCEFSGAIVKALNE